MPVATARRLVSRLPPTSTILNPCSSVEEKSTTHNGFDIAILQWMQNVVLRQYHPRVADGFLFLCREGALLLPAAFQFGYHLEAMGVNHCHLHQINTIVVVLWQKSVSGYRFYRNLLNKVQSDQLYRDSPV